MKSTLALSLSLSFTFNSILCLPSHSHFRRGHALAHQHRRATPALSDSIPNSDLFFTRRSLSPSGSSSSQGEYDEESEQDEGEDDCEEEEAEEGTNSETPPTSQAPVVTKPTDTYVSLSSTINTTSSANQYSPFPAPVKKIPVESKPVEQSINSTSSGPKPKPAQYKPSEAKPSVTKPVETKPDETKPDESKPAEQSTNSTSSGSNPKPAQYKPSETKPSVTKPVETKPDESKPLEAKPADTPTVPKKHETKDDSYTKGGHTQGISAGTYSGKATFYTQDGAAGACGTVHSDSDFIVAIDVQMYGGGKFCGRKIAVTRVSTGKTITCIAADECPGCDGAGSLDLSTHAFEELGTRDEGTFAITWSVVSE